MTSVAREAWRTIAQARRGVHHSAILAEDILLVEALERNLSREHNEQRTE